MESSKILPKSEKYPVDLISFLWLQEMRNRDKERRENKKKHLCIIMKFDKTSGAPGFLDLMTIKVGTNFSKGT